MTCRSTPVGFHGRFWERDAVRKAGTVRTGAGALVLHGLYYCGHGMEGRAAMEETTKCAHSFWENRG